MRKLALSDEILMRVEKPARYVGGELNEAYPNLTADMHEPELTVRLEVRERAAYVHGVTVREMAQAYTAFVNDGVMTRARTYSYITDDNGRVVQVIVQTDEATFISRLNNISTEAITAFKIGDDDNNYFFKGLEYRNITFFSGEEQAEEAVWNPIASSDFTTLGNALTNGSLGEIETYNHGFKSGHLTNIDGANLYSNGYIDVNGHIDNTGDMFAKGIITTTKDASGQYIYNHERAYIVTLDRIYTNSTLTNDSVARLYARNGIQCWQFVGNSGQIGRASCRERV